MLCSIIANQTHLFVYEWLQDLKVLKVCFEVALIVLNIFIYFNPIFQALEAEDKRNREMDKIMELNERKRAYNSLNINTEAPTEEEMEAYRMKRARQDDPMTQFMKQ